MNWFNAHLALNHVPVVCVPLSAALLVLAILMKSREVRTAALLVQVLAAASAGLAYFTGEEAEESARALVTIPMPLVLRHDDVAWYAMTAALLLGALALWMLVRLRRTASAPRWFAPTSLGLAVVATVLLFWTAHLGGRIRHPEIG
jgi:uncharacterized membrane protein